MKASDSARSSTHTSQVTDMELSSSLHLLLLSFPVTFFLFLVLRHNYSSNKRVRAGAYPGLKPYPLLGVLPQFIKNRHRFLDWLTEVLDQSATHTMTFQSPGQTSGIITANPDNIEHILKTSFDNYPKGERSREMLADFLGHGIFNSDGEEWRWQRKTASYEFNKRSLRNFVLDAVQHEIVDRLVPLLRRAARKDEVLDLQDVLERFAFDNICKVAFNDDPACLAGEASGGSTGARSASSGFMTAFGESQNLISGRFMDAFDFTWRFKKALNIGSERRLREVITIVHNYAMSIIQARKEKDLDGYHDLLSRFASNKDNSEEFLRDVVINFLLAGRETTSSALTWFFWILSTRPDVKRRIIQEVRVIRDSSKNNSDATFSYDELRDMHYLQAAVSESMRLYPPVPLDTQACASENTMPDGTFVGKDWFVTYSSYAMGRIEGVWGKDCKEFKPERWLEEGIFRPESPFRYPVFHGGPRMCLGKEMAYIQMKSIVACVLERFEFEVLMGKQETPGHILSVTLRMEGGLPIKVRDRLG